MIGCRPLTDDEVAALLTYLGPRDAMLLNLGLKTGFRISELLSIEIADLKEYNGQLKDAVIVKRANMKGKHSSRSVPISEATKDLLLAFLSDHTKGSQTYLFESQKGSQLSRSQAWRGIKAASRAAGLMGKIAPHSTRKTVAKKAYDASGKDLALTQKILGHKNITSTISYLGVDPENLSDVWKEIQK